jgi:predicted PurR-regulated permease PerM
MQHGTVRRFNVEPGLAAIDRGSSSAIAIGITIAALYSGRDILVPLAMAVLLSFLLAPVVGWLERLRVPRIPAVVGAVAIAFIVISGIGFLVAGQLVQLAQEVPGYQANLVEKIKAIKFIGGPDGLIGRTSEMLQELGEEVSRRAEPENVQDLTSASVGEKKPKPIPVQIEDRPSTSFEIVRGVIGPMVQPLSTAGIIVVVVIFVLLQRRDIRDRFIRLVGARDLMRTTQALEDAGERVARYLLMQLFVNVSYGVPIGVGLWLIGVPYPLLWGMMATVLRFVPYIGPVLAAALPIAMSIAVAPGWSMLLWTAALFIVLELISNNIVEPWLYGSQTGLSPLAIILAAIFWTWLWGPMGLLLSTPLTVCLVVLGRHVPQFAFLNVLLGSGAALTPEEGFHQRLLAADSDEATDLAELFLKDQSLETFYEKIALPTLVTIERDRAAGLLDDRRQLMVAQAMLTVIENLADHQDVIPASQTTESNDTPSDAASTSGDISAARSDKVILCVGARGNLDDVAASILAQLLQRRGIDARNASSTDVAPENLAGLDMAGVTSAFLCYMNEDSTAHARYLIRRLRRRVRGIKVLVGFWSMTPEASTHRKVLDGTRADMLAISLLESLDQITATSVALPDIALQA